MKEFDRQRLMIRKRLTKARNKIHVCFDLWAAPNQCAFIAHWLDEDLKKQVLIGLRRVVGAHMAKTQLLW